MGTEGHVPPPVSPHWAITAGPSLSGLWPDPILLKGAVCKSAHNVAIRPALQWSLVSGPGTVTFDDATVVQPKVQFSTHGVYAFRLTAHNDGEIKTSEMTVSLTPYNRSPWIDPGPNQIVRQAHDSITLQGVVRDDGLPLNTPVQTQWARLFGPGEVIFADPTNPRTSVSFGAEGIYILEFRATDTEFSVGAALEVRVGMRCTIEDPPGLVAWWQGNANGTEHISGNEAFLLGGAAFLDGPVGLTFRFDGINDRVQAFASPTLDVGHGHGFTVEYWVNADEARTAPHFGWHTGAGPGVKIQQVYPYGTMRIDADIKDTNNTSHVISMSGFQVGTWQHVAVTYDRASGQARIYVNGGLNASLHVGAFEPETQGDFYFGFLPGEAALFKGRLDEVSLYNRALDSQEIYEIYAAGAVGKCPKDDNTPPLVLAGPDLSLVSTNVVAPLNGQVSDDGLPPSSSLHIAWTQVTGPGTVSFAQANSAATTATFSTNGTYLLKLTADDSSIERSDLVSVRVGSLCRVEEPPGLVAWWPGNGEPREVIGGADGRWQGGTAFVQGHVGTAFTFDGVNDLVRAPAQPSLDIGKASGFTVEYWVAVSNASRTVTHVGWHSGTVPGVRLLQYYPYGALQLHANIWDTNGVNHSLIVPGFTAAGLWRHVALTYDKTTCNARVYVDGALRAAGNLGIFEPRTSSDFYLGSTPGEGVYFQGQLDEVSLYSRVLGAQETYEIYAAGQVGNCPKDDNEPPLVLAGPDRIYFHQLARVPRRPSH